MRGFVAAVGTGIVMTLCLPAASAVAHDQGGSSTAGAAAELLENFELVFNYDTDAGTRAEGTDLDFWTAPVPLRDYSTGEFVDENGDPLLPDEAGNPPEPIIAQRDFAVVGVYDLGARIFDITDPELPQLVTEVPCVQERNDTAVKLFTDADGNDVWLLALTKDDFEESSTPERGTCIDNRIGANHQAGISVFEVTDPFAWNPLYSVQFAGGAHNFTFHPTKPFGWASNGDLPGAASGTGALGFDVIPIIDFADPYAPEATSIELPAGSPHDLEFSADGTRAYVAAENHYEIYDTTDPANPERIGATPNVGSYAHGVFPTPDKKVMITNNESLVLGGFFVDNSGVCPGEGLGFYGIEGANEVAPVPLGYYAPAEADALTGYCTSHFGKVADNSHVMSIGWYVLGARIVDFSNPSVPTEVGAAVMADANVWSAKFYKGPYLYTGDFNRGFDVFKWTGDGPAPWEAD